MWSVPDGDTLSNLQEYQHGTNPRLADSDGDGFSDGAELAQLAQGADPLNGAAGLPLVLTLAAGAAQTVASGGRSAPLTVQVTQGGLPVRGAQVHFAVSSGAGSLRAQNAAAALGAQLSLTTDANGTASVVYLADGSTGSTGVTATLGSGVGGSSVDFSLTIAETATTYTYAPSNSAPFDGLVGALGGSNAPSSNPFVDPVLQADSKSMYASWQKWTDYPGQQYFKSYGLIDHMWDDKMIKVPDDGSADTSTDLTPLVIKRFQDEPWLFHADPRDASGFPWAPPALYQHYYNQTTDGPWYEPTSESEWQRRNVTALKVVTYVPQKEPAEMTFLALVYQGDGWPPASDQPRGTPVTSGVIRVKGSASTWSKSLDAYCSLKKEDGAVIVDPGPEGERLIGKTESKYIRVDLLRFDIEKASISEGQFIVNAPDVSSGAVGTLDLVFKKQGGGEVVTRTFQNQAPGKVTIALDEILTGTANTPAKPLDNQDAAKCDKIYARWRAGTVDVKTDDRAFDDVQINGQTVKVAAVEVLAKRKISNYFSPEWGGTWSGTTLSKGTYQAGQFPESLINVDVAAKFLNALDPTNEGLAMDGNTVIRDRYKPAQAGNPQVTAINGGTIPNEADSQYYDAGYIAKPDVDQDNASSPQVTLLRPTSVAVKFRRGGGTDADRLAYNDMVYIPDIPDVHLRTVDDTGGLDGNRDQIDVWRGQGDEIIANKVRNFYKPASTCLKIIPVAAP